MFAVSVALAGIGLLAPASQSRGPSEGDPRVRCEFTQATGELSIVVRDWGASEFLALRRDGPVIAPYGPAVEGENRTPLSCSDDATITATDRVAVALADDPYLHPSFGEFAINYSAGDIAPGRTAETDGESEIELSLDLPGTEVTLGVSNEAATDYSAKHGRHGVRVDTNGDGDFDVRSTASATDLFAGDAGDTFTADLGRRSRSGDPGLGFFGGGGSDRITTGGASDSAIGGPGPDAIDSRLGSSVILAGGGADRIRGGPGYQLIDAGTGDDSVDVRRGGTDEIHCGPGRDRLLADKRDIGDTTGCERIQTSGS